MLPASVLPVPVSRERSGVIRNEITWFTWPVRLIYARTTVKAFQSTL